MATNDEPSNRTSLLAILFIGLLFLAARGILSLARSPFFDELFTLWITKKPPGEIMDALRLDSGPPMYYLFAKAWMRISGVGIASARLLSLTIALGTFVCVASRRGAFGARTAISALLLLALFPPHVYFSTEARAYVLGGLFVGIASLGLDAWRSDGSRRSLFIAALALVLAAYSHYYGALLFPALLAVAVWRRKRAMIIDASIATLGVLGAFVPGLLLATSQPREAIEWMGGGAVFRLLGALTQLGFASVYPQAIAAPAPLVLQIASFSVVVLLALRTMKNSRATGFAIITLVPIAGALVLYAVGRWIYFPTRFESIVAVPFVLWLASASEEWHGRTRVVLVVAAALIGGLVIWKMTESARHARASPYRAVAHAAATKLRPGESIIATEYAYLEAISLVDESRVRSVPRDQALHPGWVRGVSPDERLGQLQEIVRESRGSFLWIGYGNSLEWRWLTREFDVETISASRPIVVARVRSR